MKITKINDRHIIFTVPENADYNVNLGLVLGKKHNFIIDTGMGASNIIIFDEATSAIDNLTEELVMKNVMALLSGKTVIAIAHRLDSIKEFDSIIVFQDGNIVEQGRFPKLIEKRQYFYELYNRTI